jgi:hypothetical protein
MVRAVAIARVTTVVPAVGRVTTASHGKRRGRYDRYREKSRY